MSFKIDDSYVDVAERIRLFYEKFPDGRLTRLGEPKLMEVGDRLFVMYTAMAYRTPDDPVPAIGTAWEPFPGPTQFTRDSELMNSETSAWGRAIIAAGIPSKKIASSQEVEARRGTPIVEPKRLTAAQAEKVRAAVADCGVTVEEWEQYRGALGARSDAELTTEQAKVVRKWLDGHARSSDIPADVPFVESEADLAPQEPLDLAAAEAA